MQRREFLLLGGSLVVVLPISAALEACGGDGGGDGNGGGAPTSTDEELFFTSTSNDGHTHGLRLAVSEIDGPPAGGLSRDTSRNQAHTHRVTLTEDDLRAIGDGQSVTKPTTQDSGHSHAFTFSRA